MFLTLSDILPNAVNPRKDFNQEALDELAFSITQHGVIQPITVRRIIEGEHYSKYEIISGERRFRASKIAGKTEIPAYIRSEKEGEISMLELALIENIQREDLNAIEIAISYQRLLEECKFSQEELSDRVAKKRSTVSNYLRLLRLCPEIQAAIRDQRISMGHARALLSLEDSIDKQLALFALVLEDGLSVRQTEDLVRKQHIADSSAQTNSSDIQPLENKEYKNQEVLEMQEKLSALFDMRVNIICTKKGNGKIVLNFNNMSEVNRVMNNLGF